MGTSGSYGGSGGQDWNELQRELDRWLDGLPGADDDTTNGNGSIHRTTSLSSKNRRIRRFFESYDR